jgi:hypothetical protein
LTAPPRAEFAAGIKIKGPKIKLLITLQEKHDVLVAVTDDGINIWAILT